MTRQRQADDVRRAAGFLGAIVRQAGLILRLMADARVPLWVKLIPPLAILYILFPLDLIPDLVPGLGQLDDLAIALLGLGCFVELCPSEVVQHHREAMSSNRPGDAKGEVVDADYRVIDDM